MFEVTVSDPDSSAVLAEIHMRDGGDSSNPDAGIVTPAAHAGTLHVVNSEVEDFRGGGIDNSPVSDFGGADGRVRVVGGLYKNNNIANLNIAGAGSDVFYVTSIQTSGAPVYESSTNDPTIWISGGRVDVQATDLIYTGVSTNAIRLGEEGATGGGMAANFQNNRIRNDHDQPVIDAHLGDWVGNNNSFVGEGDLTFTGSGTVNFANTCRGGSCDAPTETPTVTWEVNDY
jgi:hypothetical protein